jgi:hypothetical protein
MKATQISNITRPGENHTGVTLHPDFVTEMIRGTSEFGPTSGGGAELLAENRIRYMRQSEPMATMPPAPELPLERLPVIDKLGARLAFERAGVRLYEALISKLDGHGMFRGGPSRADLEHIRDQEHQHLVLAHHMIVQLGGDPTVITPCANVQATASRGIGDVLTDPRTSLIDCLQAIIMIELADNESWEHLGTTIAPLGDQQLEAKIRDAQRTEAEHLTKVRGWLTAADRLLGKPTD